MEKATLSVIESGRMTGDLALITVLPNPVKLGSEEFLDAIAEQFRGL
jgi:isocitrate dehydrogenase